MPEKYYEDDNVILYHGDALALTDLWISADVLVSDVPYGIAYQSNAPHAAGSSLARSIMGDTDTSARDKALEAWGGERPALIFGTWRAPRPGATRQVLIWDTRGALGMGAMDLPWKPAHQEVYVLGRGFVGRRTTDVLSVAPVQSTAANGRQHPHQKPVALMEALIAKCPPGTIADPFAGSGSTLVAAKALGRNAIGVELDEQYCEIAARRLAQDVLDFGGMGAQ